MHLVLYSPTPPAGMHQGAAGARRLASSSSRAGAVMAGTARTLSFILGEKIDKEHQV